MSGNGGAGRRVTDVLVQMKATSFEPQFTYALPEDAPEADFAIGVVVRVPLARKEHFGYITGPIRDARREKGLRAIIEVIQTPRAFDEEGLALAQWMAHTYCCTLSEAIGAIVYQNAIPKTVDRIVPINRDLASGRAGIPERLVDLLFDSAAESMAVEEILRHPEARRAADRPNLRKALAKLVSVQAVRRERVTLGAAVREKELRTFYPVGDSAITGKKARAFIAWVHENPGITAAQAHAAGFSTAILARAVASQAVREERIPMHAAPVVTLRPPAELRAARAAYDSIIPTHEQANALAVLAQAADARAFSETLIHGVTGSGKTYVYLETIRKIVERGGSAIVLVPEIALTPQTAARFEAVFGEKTAVIHSGLSERARFEAWLAASRGEVRVIVGARSAVFVPLPNLQAIFIDEAHETTYRQELTPRYATIAVARERMRMRAGLLVLGSATPPLDAYAQAKLGRIGLVELHERATNLPLPHTEIIDLAAEARTGNRGIFSTRVLQAIENRITLGEKSVLFVHRRGTARFVLCRPCGFVPNCPRCSLSLTYHREEGLLRCHLCDAQEPMTGKCPRCGAQPMAPFGLGTERVASELQELFPHAKIIRMDSDTTTRAGDHQRLLDRFAQAGDILVGTQMIAKGLDFPTVTLAAVVAADTGLHVADFRASERTFGLLTQVAGRSGRARPGEAFIQTYLPEHPAVVCAARHDYEGFAREELQERKLLRYPPFSKLSYLTLVGRERDSVLTQANATANALKESGGPWEVFGPTFAHVPRINNEWRIRMALKCARLDPLRDYLRTSILPRVRESTGVRYILELDVT